MGLVAKLNQLTIIANKTPVDDSHMSQNTQDEAPGSERREDIEGAIFAIAKFGETVDLHHAFDSGPFSDQAGTKVTNAFRFSQKATNALSLLETNLKVLSARELRVGRGSSNNHFRWNVSRSREACSLTWLPRGALPMSSPFERRCTCARAFRGRSSHMLRKVFVHLAGGAAPMREPVHFQ